MTAADLPPLALPCGATHSSEWEIDQEIQYRIVSGDERRLDSGISAQTTAVQYRDGTINSTNYPPEVFLYGVENEGFTALQARSLAVLLTQAADELDRWLLD